MTPQASLLIERTAHFGVYNDNPRTAPYRYRLARRWAKGATWCWVMLNPSTADAYVDDPTVWKCMEYARRAGAGGIEVVNIFALRSTDPAGLLKVDDPIGPENDAAIRDATMASDVVICAWGKHGKLGNRGPKVRADLIEMFGHGDRLRALKLNKDGSPVHPLYQRYDVQMISL